jgi:hypothetical protein
MGYWFSSVKGVNWTIWSVEVADSDADAPWAFQMQMENFAGKSKGTSKSPSYVRFAVADGALKVPRHRANRGSVVTAASPVGTADDAKSVVPSFDRAIRYTLIGAPDVGAVADPFVRTKTRPRRARVDVLSIVAELRPAPFASDVRVHAGVTTVL